MQMVNDEQLYERLDAIRQSLNEESIRPTCPGCARELLWIDEQNPRCACGALLYWPTTERI
jgi:hypothetical protein